MLGPSHKGINRDNTKMVLEKSKQLVSMNTYLAAQGEPLENGKAPDKDLEGKNKKNKKRWEEPESSRSQQYNKASRDLIMTSGFPR